MSTGKIINTSKQNLLVNKNMISPSSKKMINPSSREIKSLKKIDSH